MSHMGNASSFSDDFPAHRSRPSLTTNASGFAESTLSYTSMTTAEGLQRLSQFPSPPPGVPISPFEAQMGLSETAPHRDGYEMVPPDTPTASSYYPSPEVPFVPLHRLSPLPRSTILSGTSMEARSASRASRPLPVPLAHSLAAPASAPRTPVLSPSSPPPLSPQDWHDSSSSIAADPYEERVLSTTAITSLLADLEDQRPRSPPPKYKRNIYDPSIISGINDPNSLGSAPPHKGSADSYPPVPSHPLIPSDPFRGPLQSTSVLPPVPEWYPPSPTVPVGPSNGRGSSAFPGRLSTTRSGVGSTPSSHFFPLTESIPEDFGTEHLQSGLPSPPPLGRGQERRISATSSHTSKSYVSSLMTRFSIATGDRKSSRRSRLSKGSLPLAPRLPSMTAMQEAEFQRAEAALPLPELINRAQALSHSLDSGERSYTSRSHLSMPFSSSPSVGLENTLRDDSSGIDPRSMLSLSAHDRQGRSQEPKVFDSDGSSHHARLKRGMCALSRRQKYCIGISLLLVIISAVAAAVVVIVGKRRSQSKCHGDMAGALCSLNASCACTGPTGGPCGSKLAQNLVDLVPTLNELFSTSYTPATLSNAVWLSQGDPGDSCVGQALLVDVAPGIDPTTSPNRTQWAQTALLWNLAESMSLDDVSTLREFILSAGWSKLTTADGPNSASGFTTSVSGYDFNFAAQTVSPPPATFVGIGQPSQIQIDKVNGGARSTLDRMYSFASASATQQRRALSTYWTAVLQQKSSSLNQFLSRVRGSPVLLPFDATLSPGNHNLSSLMTNSRSSPFPPPLACYPGLTGSQLKTLNTFEGSAFGLPPASPASGFDPVCFGDRPIYGVLNILRLRLPFVEDRVGVGKQAAVLSSQTSGAQSRVIVYSGGSMSALPGSPALPNVTAATTNPRRFGTLNNLDHVVLSYLQSIADVNVAIALVEFVLSGSSVPPTSNSILFKALATLPLLEVAVFGTIDPADVDSVASSLSDPVGKLFFGTDHSLAIRNWGILAVRGTVVWTELSISPEVVRDASFTDSGFNLIWDSAYNFFHVPNNLDVSLGNITDGFANVGKLSP